MKLYIIIPVIILIIIFSLIIGYLIIRKLNKNSLRGGEAKFTQLTGELKNLLGSSELSQIVKQKMSPQVWANYTAEATKTATKLSTEIAKITANPLGLLTNILLSPEGIKFIISSGVKNSIANIKNIKYGFNAVKNVFNKDKNKKNDENLKKMLIPYVKTLINLIVVAYKKDIYQPFIQPIINLILRFPLLTDNLRIAFNKVFNIYSYKSINLILYQSINVILNSNDKIKDIYALFYNLVNSVLNNMENVLSVFVNEIKTIIKNSGKIIENDIANTLSVKANNLVGKITTKTNLDFNKQFKNVSEKINKSELGKIIN